MTDNAQPETHSKEEKFFGISTEVGPPEPPEEGKEEKIEVVHTDEPETPAVAKPAEPEGDGSDMGDEELEKYSTRVQKRMNHLTWKANEERRKREAAEELGAEAIRVTQLATNRNTQYENIIRNGEGHLVRATKERAEFAVRAATEQATKAHESGVTEDIVKAQDALGRAQMDQRDAQAYEQDYTARTQRTAAQPQPQPNVLPQTPAPQVPKPTERSQQWATDNPWFNSTEHPDMTALAYGVHEDLIRNKGIRPDTDEYFGEIDSAMRTRFPEHFKEAKPSARNRQSVVAPAGRDSGGKTRKVTLSSTQRALARRLGVPEEQYAAEYLKLEGKSYE